MNKLTCLFICLALVILCKGQTSSKNEIYNKDFNWTITIPENFQSVSSEEWAKVQNRGAEAIEKTYDTKIVNHSKTIFVFKSDQLNYFESNYQPFQPAADGDYSESRKAVNNIMYETFKAQMPGVQIDTATAVEKVDGLEFQTFNIKVEYPNKMVLNVMMFSRLFDKKEFSVNIMYVDSAKGRQMLESWRMSKFGK